MKIYKLRINSLGLLEEVKKQILISGEKNVNEFEIEIPSKLTDLEHFIDIKTPRGKIVNFGPFETVTKDECSYIKIKISNMFKYKGIYSLQYVGIKDEGRQIYRSKNIIEIKVEEGVN